MDFSDTLKQLQSKYLINNSSFELEHERTKLLYIDMIKQVKPDYFVTLTFAYDVSEYTAIVALKALIWHVNKQVYRRNVKDENNRLTILPFIETSTSSQLHFHLLVKQPNSRPNANLCKIFRQKWQSINIHGFATFKRDEWFKKIDDLDGIAKYITKQIYGDSRPLVVECLNY